MNIAVFGWYHHRNAGDDRLQYCITRWLDGHTLAFLPAGRRTPPASFLRSYDAVLIGGGGILQQRGGLFRDMAAWVGRAGVPVALVGVSAEQMPDDLRAELRSFLDVCCFAWFRDEASLDAVGEHESAFVAPDLTWLYPYPVAGEGHGTAVSLRSGGDVPVPTWRRSLETLDGPLRPWPLFFESASDPRFLRDVLPDLDQPDEFSLAPVVESARVVTNRYHSLVFGAQTGRALIGVGGSPKVRRFLDEAGLGEWWLAAEAVAELPARAADLDRRAPAVRAQVERVRMRSVEAATDAAATSLDQLANAVRARRRRPLRGRLRR